MNLGIADLDPCPLTLDHAKFLVILDNSSVKDLKRVGKSIT